ncbi:MAG: NAD(P)/FAD-dependent oxidoreductase [Candidatus Binatus sp.]|uniref:flavin-containing monooxygenase n=1 Tax=Candidatus Binatus sp. TaxID=2811406 RepID=UPI00271D1D5E|nr:NAD(P)/FAD-dependent oxidoreductase [Candidatus Binatus sp.]MDO8432952.1 NAD(P)/FAD-dependent oxidoreductase [Candidatus Binatus sp.]
MSAGVTEAESKRIPTPEELGFDPAKLRRKYAAEREKRLRVDGNNQYREITGALEHYNSDPYVDPGFTRPALNEELEAVIVGGGFGGLLAAARLQKKGITNIRIIEKAGDFGGTWYWNRYPGAQCDIESYVYLPLLEETGYLPQEKYSFAPEIFEHAQRIGKHFNLYERACFQTQVKEARWDDGEGRWIVKTDRGDVFKARFVIMSSGPLNRPKLPAIPGIEKFKGHTFHTSRWDYSYTGGDTNGGLHKLSDKRVGIVGTGATAIQSVSHLGQHAKQLYVFQRTPSSVDERGNKPTDPEWASTLTPGWQAYRNHNFCSILSGIPIEEDLVGDKWTSLFKNLAKLMSGKDANVSGEEMALMSEIADYQKMNEIRDRVSSTVSDPQTADALKPWYGQWCKRPTFNDEYLPTFNRPNVKLVDTKGKGVERVTENAVIVDGVEYEVDCLIFATGFEVGTAYTRRSEFEVYGRGGLPLSDYWANGMKTHHGFMSHGFPNCFHMGLTQTGLAPNFTYMLEGQATHIAHVIKAVKDREGRSVEPTPEAEAEWVKIVTAPSMITEYQNTCTPGYYNGEGKSAKQGFLGSQYPDGAVRFYEMLARWREQGDFEGLLVE